MMKNAGLVVREDVMGNIFGRWQGSNASAGVQTCRRCPSKPRQSLTHTLFSMTCSNLAGGRVHKQTVSRLLRRACSRHERPNSLQLHHACTVWQRRRCDSPAPVAAG